MTLILIGIAAVWLTVSVPCALLFARTATLGEGNEQVEQEEHPAPQLQLLSTPRVERERVA